MAVEYAGQDGTGDVELPGRLCHGQAEGGEYVFAQGYPWM